MNRWRIVVLLFLITLTMTLKTALLSNEETAWLVILLGPGTDQQPKPREEES